MGTQLFLPQNEGTAAPSLFGPCLLWPNSWVDEGATWYGGRSRPRPRCVRWGPNSRQRKGTQQPPLFGPCLLWPNGRPSQQFCDSLLTWSPTLTTLLICNINPSHKWGEHCISIDEDDGRYGNYLATLEVEWFEWFSLSSSYCCSANGRVCMLQTALVLPQLSHHRQPARRHLYPLRQVL